MCRKYITPTSLNMRYKKGGTKLCNQFGFRAFSLFRSELFSLAEVISPRSAWFQSIVFVTTCIRLEQEQGKVCLGLHGKNPHHSIIIMMKPNRPRSMKVSLAKFQYLRPHHAVGIGRASHVLGVWKPET